MLRAVLLGCLAASPSVAHICAISPQQRGAMAVDTPGADPCYRRTPQCGGMPPEEPKVTYPAGSTATLLFQQNLNHWNDGHFDIAIAYNPAATEDSDFTVLWSAPDYPAHDQVTQTNFTARVQIPATTSDHAVLRYRYVSMNKGEIDPKNNTDAIFWNCVDVRISAAEAQKQAQPEAAENQAQQRDFSCCAPQRFQMQARERTVNGEVHHQIWWDATSNLTRWDRIGALEPTQPNGRLQLFNNYTNMDEWVYDPDTDKCELFGSDPFYPWCFGSAYHMTYEGNSTRDGAQVNVWGNSANGFRWQATAAAEGAPCYPVSRERHGERADESVALEFFNQGPIRSDGFFQLPAACHSVTKRSGCRRV